ncbi:MAG: hypothetical protein A2W90_10285 [Bacteroidetes bacterium GWF2_42_66]|nr:MAG: hypothetical protein A2W92_23980 [Bacteroidetes bacterium GWA2_42_15]OFY01522.1 MAG: hypothetical protein A2W89_02230 [Bacteroidetes bacterium GWE2_42_39]OFY43297.1 MAG: hypothetical protein A2W90_10285 [Bacteroidetes bacterium GWF2_42_66]HBL77520.1 endolytic transglycosylase MltG [Prolixibacteraceae bacterium]HCR90683.1 endolytic transglycosylase MltG [Prolixibacteraceae bacterium]
MEFKPENKIMLFPRINKIIIIVVAIAFVITGIRGYQLFKYIFEINVKTPGSIIISREANFNQVLDSLKKHDILINNKAFKWVSKRKKYSNSIKPGKYLFDSGMNTNQIVNMLRSGSQEPVVVTFNNIRNFKQLAAAISKYIEPDSLLLLQRLTDTTMYAKYGFTERTIPCMYIPNSYEFYWTTTPEQFTDRMAAEYKRFWTDDRKAKATAKGLTPEQVSTIASIVQEETVKNEEKPIVAGLYLNRLKKGMLLQADPTIKFALNDFTIRRVLNEYLLIDSPYNTYKYAGLPPGPINFPEISSIEAVLNAEKHNYMYMCAKEDFSGYHNFAVTLDGHNQNARKYQAALNKNKIWK